VSARAPHDPVAVRRSQVARAVKVGKAIGYSCFGLAVVLFGMGYAVGFTELLTGMVVGLLLVGCVALPPAIVFGYGLRAAERHEREERAEREAAQRRRAGNQPGPSAPSDQPDG
jgi:hypothetical protein